MTDQNTSSGPDYPARQAEAARRIGEYGIDLLLLHHSELASEPLVRYLTGFPEEAVLLLPAAGEPLLFAWDMELARRRASCPRLRQYTEVNRNPVEALALSLQEGEISFLSKKPAGGEGGATSVELSPATAHLLYREMEETIEQARFFCRREGAWQAVSDMRKVKDAWELALYERAAEMTNRLIEKVVRRVGEHPVPTEAELSLFITAEGTKMGAESTSFSTLAAGPERSWAIHAAPPSSNAPFLAKGGGLSLVDFGLKVDGYATDVTVSFSDRPDPRQQEMVRLVREAFLLAADAAEAGVSSRSLMQLASAFFARHGFTLPHGLGHGIGLEIHEPPFLRDHPHAEAPLMPGTVFTIEPGLYSSEAGGVRLENDVLCTSSGVRILTKSRIVDL
ncbi:MAG: Xaa-Pro peptidase family protein [Spirochaetales bacterium]|nr:Xaa-Pro peptidase family protein [Spirochaetales bacterium]MCF7937374.1 Xaa-Pro peptidase family protein [Spirochaetales bacterium]